MKTQSIYRGHRFPAAIIAQTARWHFRFQLSLRDIYHGGHVACRGMVLQQKTQAAHWR